MKTVLSRISKKSLLFILIYLGLILIILIFMFTIKYPQIQEMYQALQFHPTNVYYPTIYIKESDQNVKYLSNLNQELEKIQFKQIQRFKIIIEDKSQRSINENNIPIFRIVISNANPLPQKHNSDLNHLLIKKSIFVPVGHFYWIADSLNTQSNSQFYCLKDECKILASAYPQIKFLPIDTENQLLQKLKNSESIPGIINIHDLNINYKLLIRNNGYYLDTFSDNNALPVYIYLKPENTIAQKLIPIVKNIFTHNPNITKYIHEKSDIDSNNTFTFIQTGVTAISRALAMKMNAANDMQYPARDIASFLKQADLTHTSNEVSFVPGCKPIASMRFCSNPKYFDTLKAIGLDIVELTGNHNNDYGNHWNTWTIQNYYKKFNIDYFGGGLNDKDASKILYKKVKNTTIALIGYNYYDTIYNHYNALATKNHAGANSFSFNKLKNDIKRAKEHADIVIVDFQFQECYCYPDHDVVYPICYKPLSTPNQRKVFRTAIDYGADIVVGTQAHQPQTYELYKNKPIFYGLGNLFFDQIYWIGTRQGLILKHYFYNQKLMQTRIITLLQSKDFKQHIVWNANRTKLLQYLKQAR